jgi:hypothetical protein
MMRNLLPVLVAIILVVVTAFVYGRGYMWLDLTVITALVTNVLLSVNKQTAGHGVLTVQSYILKMPRRNFMYYLTCFLLLTIYTLTSLEYADDLKKTMWMLCFSIYVSLLTGLFDWYRLAYYETFYLEEDVVRRNLEHLGRNPIEIEREIEFGRKSGFFGPSK